MKLNERVEDGVESDGGIGDIFVCIDGEVDDSGDGDVDGGSGSLLDFVSTFRNSSASWQDPYDNNFQVRAFSPQPCTT